MVPLITHCRRLSWASTSAGLGVCNRSEGSGCSSPQHQVDNNTGTARDWVLFKFSEAVDITTVRVDPTGAYDTDVTYWTANSSTFNGNLDGLTYT